MPKIVFDLNSRYGSYKFAEIHPGLYPKAQPDDPQQIGWQVLSEDGEPLGQPTVNLWDPPQFPAPGCVFVKITPEYEGWLESLEAAGLVERTGRICPAGFVEHYAAEARVLNPELLKIE